MLVPKARLQFYFSHAGLQMEIITACELSSGLSRSVVYHSLEPAASMQSALCPQNLTPTVYGVWNQSFLNWRANDVTVSACTLASTLSVWKTIPQTTYHSQTDSPCGLCHNGDLDWTLETKFTNYPVSISLAHLHSAFENSESLLCCSWPQPLIPALSQKRWSAGCLCSPLWKYCCDGSHTWTLWNAE